MTAVTLVVILCGGEARVEYLSRRVMYLVTRQHYAVSTHLHNWPP